MLRLTQSTGLLLAALLASETAAAGAPNDPAFADQWALQNIGQVVNGKAGTSGADIRALEAWDIFSGSSSIIVAIVATGVDPHPEFADRLLQGHVVPAAGGDPYSTLDTGVLGTRVAGIIGAAQDNAVGIAGVNGKARLLPVRVLLGTVGTEASTAEGIEWAVDHGAGVIVVPLQFYVGTQRLADAVSYAALHDVVVVAPAGHTAGSDVAYPAAFEGCVAVASTTQEDAPASFSNHGPQVDLSAPSVNIWSTLPSSAYGFETNPGSGSAAAYVGGVASLIRSYAPQLSALEVRQLLIDSADDLGNPGWDAYFGTGRLNAGRSLEIAEPPALRFENLHVLPATIPPGSTLAIRIVDAAEQVDPTSAKLFYRVATSGFAAPIPLRSLGGADYAIDFPSVPCGTTIEYYLSAAGMSGEIVTDPLDAPKSLHVAEAIHLQSLFDDDFEDDLGWEVVAEGGASTRGLWMRDLPRRTLAQPEFDRSPDYGRFCFLTDPRIGADDGTYDVDGGPVRLLSPILPLSMPDAEIAYSRWMYSAYNTLDVLTVEMSRNGGLSWVKVETVGGTGGWVSHRFRLSQFPSAIGDQLRIRFSVADLDSDSLTEAAVDEFHVRAISCTSVQGDADGDGDVDLADYRRFRPCLSGPLNPPSDPACAPYDWNPNGRIDLLDFGIFQNLFDPQ